MKSNKTIPKIPPITKNFAKNNIQGINKIVSKINVTSPAKKKRNVQNNDYQNNDMAKLNNVVNLGTATTTNILYTTLESSAVKFAKTLNVVAEKMEDIISVSQKSSLQHEKHMKESQEQHEQQMKKNQATFNERQILEHEFYDKKKLLQQEALSELILDEADRTKINQLLIE